MKMIIKNREEQNGIAKIIKCVEQINQKQMKRKTSTGKQEMKLEREEISTRQKTQHCSLSYKKNRNLQDAKMFTTNEMTITKNKKNEILELKRLL